MVGDSENPPNPDEMPKSSISSLFFIQLLLLAPPILTAPIIFTSGNIGEDYGVDLLILGIIGAEFLILASWGFWRSSNSESFSELATEIDSMEEFELSCIHCSGVFLLLVDVIKNNHTIIESCTYCGEESSIRID